MTMVGGGDTTMQLLQLVQTMKQRRQERQREQALTLLNSLQPGERLQDLPGAAKAYKTATGQEAQPGRIIKEPTLEDVMRRQGVATYQALPEGLQVGLAKNQIINAAQGTTGRQTEASFKSTGQELEATTRARAGTAQAGAATVAKATPKQQAAIGTKQIYGQTPAEAQAGEAVAGATEAKAGTEVVQAGVEKQQFEYVKNFLDDPQNSAYGKILQGYGIDATAATQAFAAGQGTMLTGLLSLEGQKAGAQAQAQADLTKIKFESGLRMREELDKARINSAQAFQAATNGRIGIRTSLAVENAIETGKDPYSIGVAAPDVKLILTAKEIGMTSYLRTAVNKDNPQAQLLKDLTSNMHVFGADLDQLQAVNTVAGQTAAHMITEKELGPRERFENDPDQLAQWDERARFNYRSLALTGKNARKWLTDKAGVTQQPIWMQQNSGVDTTAAGSKTKIAGATPGNKTPGFVDPSAARAVQAAIGAGQDSTNMTPNANETRFK